MDTFTQNPVALYLVIGLLALWRKPAPPVTTHVLIGGDATGAGG